jgi:hypothetical protein
VKPKEDEVENENVDIEEEKQEEVVEEEKKEALVVEVEVKEEALEEEDAASDLAIVEDQDHPTDEIDPASSHNDNLTTTDANEERGDGDESEMAVVEEIAATPPSKPLWRPSWTNPTPILPLPPPVECSRRRMPMHALLRKRNPSLIPMSARLPWAHNNNNKMQTRRRNGDYLEAVAS